MKDLYHDSVFYLKTCSWESKLSDADIYKKIVSRAQSNDPDFLVLQSWYLSLGKGCKRDISTAIKLLETSTVQLNVGSLCAAGLGFLRGYYGEPNEAIALSYFDQAEKICPRKASYQKGYMHFNRYFYQGGTVSDLKKARLFFEKAAKRGHATSLNFHVFCRTGTRTYHIYKYFLMLVGYLLARKSLGGPERWWCYRDLEAFRPPAVRLAEGCGHALGYFAKK